MSISNRKCDHLLMTLRKITRALDLHSKQLVQKYGLTGPQMTLLKSIWEKSDQHMTSKQLSNIISLSQATVTSILDRLTERGYITRVKCQHDRRKIYIRLTDRAVQVFIKNPTLLQEDFVSQFTALHDWEQSLLLSSLERIANMMDTKKIDTA